MEEEMEHQELEGIFLAKKKKELEGIAMIARGLHDTLWESKSDSRNFKIPGLRFYSFSIYRVPNWLRRKNPQAYTPEALLIGPLQHSKKAKFYELSKTDLRYLEYEKMELHKKGCLTDVARKFGDQTVQEFRRVIQINENFIRKCYAESTDWINSHEFVEMILLDSVFILVFFLQTGTQKSYKQGDTFFQGPYHIKTILEDLILLENQLPYALLEKLFEPFFLNQKLEKSFRDTIFKKFGFENMLEREVEFRHLTDLFRCVRVATLGSTEERATRAMFEKPKSIRSLQNAETLYHVGVVFVNENKGNDLSLEIDFQDGVLKMPCFIADNNTEKIMRNLMALEQFHYPREAYICNYIDFLNFFIKTEQDVDLLAMQGVVKNSLTSSGSVREMVEKLCLEIVDYGSHYYHIAERLNEYYKNSHKQKRYYINRINRSLATLRQVYFKDLWTGTATLGAVIIVVLTLIGTVASVLQVRQNNNSSTKSLPPPPAQKP